MAKLVVLSEGLAGTTYELKVERTTIGRVEDNAFQIAQPSVSGHHCEVLLRGTEVVVKDLGSTNGTFINGQQVTESVVKPGQILRVGQVEMRLENGAPAPASKKQLDHTSVIPQGVRLNELELGTQVRTATVPFAKKSNKISKIVILVCAVLGALIIGLIIYAIFMTGNVQ